MLPHRTGHDGMPIHETVVGYACMAGDASPTRYVGLREREEFHGGPVLHPIHSWSRLRGVTC